MAPAEPGLDLRQNVVHEPPHVYDSLRRWGPAERRPQQGHRQPGIPITLEIVSDLLCGANQRWRELAPWRLISFVARDLKRQHARNFEPLEGLLAPPLRELLLDGCAPGGDRFRRVHDPDPAFEAVLGNTRRRDLGLA